MGKFSHSKKRHINQVFKRVPNSFSPFLDKLKFSDYIGGMLWSSLDSGGKLRRRRTLYGINIPSPTCRTTSSRFMSHLSDLTSPNQPIRYFVTSSGIWCSSSRLSISLCTDMPLIVIPLEIIVFRISTSSLARYARGICRRTPKTC
jgi:hypothetical protein